MFAVARVAVRSSRSSQYAVRIFLSPVRRLTD